MKKFLLVIALFAVVAMISTSCADSKTFVINGKETVVEPYGWANASAQKNDSVVYQACIGNIVWDVILIETVIVPVWLTGWELYEPVRLK